MKIIYTEGKEEKPIYVTEEQYEIVKDKKWLVINGTVACYLKGRKTTIASILYPKFNKISRIDTTVYDYRPSNIKNHIGFIGVSATVKKGILYYVCSVTTRRRQINVPGYYKTQEEARLAREAYIIKNNINNAVRNDIELSDKEILAEYEKLIKSKENKRKDDYINSREKAIKNHESYGVHKTEVEGVPVFSAYVRGKIVGTSLSSMATKCIRNIYIIDNSIVNDKIYDVGMTVDEQREFIKEYKYRASLKLRKKNKYKGVCTYKCDNRIYYSAKLNNGIRTIHIGMSKDINLSAMMYNLYLFNNGREPINNVGLSVDKQLETLQRHGYYMTEDFRFKKRKGNK